MHGTPPISPGTRYGELVVLALRPDVTPAGKRQYLCRCDCGTEVVVAAGNLNSGNSKSCGCRKRRYYDKPTIRLGERFGRLLVVAAAPATGNKRRHWLCVCECGTNTIVDTTSLRSGNAKSCGCLKRDRTRARATTHGHDRPGLVTPTYWTWIAMKARCSKPAHVSYRYYGARGIGVCDRWETSFENFLEDMGERPEGKTLDRINNDGNYEPRNCRWATTVEQANNKRKRVK